MLSAGWPETVPGVTVDRQCGSSQQSLHFAVAGVVAGHYDAVVAGGVESMSRVPDARGTPPNMPFWIGEGPGRSRERDLHHFLRNRVSKSRRAMASPSRLRGAWKSPGLRSANSPKVATFPLM